MRRRWRGQGRCRRPSPAASNPARSGEPERRDPCGCRPPVSAVPGRATQRPRPVARNRRHRIRSARSRTGAGRRSCGRTRRSPRHRATHRPPTRSSHGNRRDAASDPTAANPPATAAAHTTHHAHAHRSRNAAPHCRDRSHDHRCPNSSARTPRTSSPSPATPTANRAPDRTAPTPRSARASGRCAVAAGRRGSRSRPTPTSTPGTRDWH